MNEQQMQGFAALVARTVVEELRKANLVAEPIGGDAPMVLGDLTIDFRAHKAQLRGVDLRLTRQQFATLALLARNRGTTMTREMIVSLAWPERGEELGSTRTVDQQVRVIRAALGSDRDVIKTVPGIGYRIDRDFER